MLRGQVGTLEADVRAGLSAVVTEEGLPAGLGWLICILGVKTKALAICSSVGLSSDDGDLGALAACAKRSSSS